MKSVNRRTVGRACLAAFLALWSGIQPVAAQCPSYPDRPRISATVVWRYSHSNRVYAANGAYVEVIDRWGIAIRHGYTDRNGKVSFRNLPVGSRLRARSTFLGQTSYALDNVRRIAEYTINRCDAHSPRIFHVF